jgi:hypothetical protein
MMEELMLEWLKIVWSCRPGAFLNQPSMFVLDAFKGHVFDSVNICNMKTELVVIPCGMISLLQPMDVAINKPFKDRLRQQYLTWIADRAHELTETGKIKSAAPSEVARWVLAAWKAIPESIMTRSFEKCCISNALDGSKNDIVWKDDVEDKDDSDWVVSMDNDSVMSDDGESDE